MSKKLHKQITNAQAIIEQEVGKSHPALKTGWQYPSLPNGYSLACVRFKGTQQAYDALLKERQLIRKISTI